MKRRYAAIEYRARREQNEGEFYLAVVLSKASCNLGRGESGKVYHRYIHGGSTSSSRASFAAAFQLIVSNFSSLPTPPPPSFPANFTSFHDVPTFDLISIPSCFSSARTINRASSSTSSRTEFPTPPHTRVYLNGRKKRDSPWG